MIKKLLFVTTILLALSLTAMAADVSGKWTFEQAGRGGGAAVTVTLTLKAAGSTLTGNVSRPGPNGNMDTPISDGKVDGNNVSFKTSVEMGGQTRVTEYSGTMAGDELKLKMTRPGRDGSPMTTEATAKRSTT